MLVCDAGGATWAVAHADVRDPAQVGEATSQLLQAARANIGAEPTSRQLIEVPGMTPNSQAGRAVMQGHRPDGTAVRQDVAAFSHGAQVFQATVVSAPGQALLVEPFFESLRFAPAPGAHSGP